MARTLRQARGRESETRHTPTATFRGDDAATTDDRDTNRRGDDAGNTPDERRLGEGSRDRTEQAYRQADARVENEGTDAAAKKR